MTIAKKIAKNNSNVDTANNTVISMTQYNDLLAWAEKVSNGQLDAATQIKTHCATWLNADIDKNTVIDIIKADDLNGFRNFLAQFNFTVKDDAGYIHKLHTCDNGDCVLAEMPTSESATTNTEVKETDDEDREKFLRAKEEIKTTAGRYLGDGKFAQIWQRNNGFGWRNIAKKNAALILAEYGLTVDEYLAAKKQWVAEGVARSALGAAAEDFAAAIIAPAKVLALPAPVDTATKENNANELPTGKITVKSGTEAWAIVGKHFPKDNLEFCRAGKGFNNEDTFCYTLDEIIYVHATCTPDNKRVECIEIVNTYEESESERNILTVYINHDAATESAMEDAKTPEVDKSATADSLTRAMTIALESYQAFCRVGNLTAATNELSLYNICRKAMSELWKEEAA